MMNKHTGLSDFEINKKVAINVGGFALSLMVFDDRNGVVKKNIPNIGSRVFTEFNPCNNPADAMPIIIENGISMVRVNNAWSARQFNNHCIEINGDNYYRIAMEVYLLMNGK
ncbi:phage protein NinX family protein [Providencia alcalifaciens]|uniref:phage protein NinX family protein n=1 Tax=Providencia alcalifaciens TaxID=126385 RepID=UPI001E3EAB16|nr:phage protein NinX family protein [Providencia alcalifaciens]